MNAFMHSFILPFGNFKKMIFSYKKFISAAAIYLALFGLMGIFFHCPAYGYYDSALQEKPFKIIKTKIRRWQTSGSALFQISFLTPSSWWIPPADNILAGSTLNYKKMNTALNLFSVEVSILKGFSVEFEYGDNKFSKGKCFDHDWLHAPDNILYLLNGVVWTQPSHKDFSESVSEIEGTTKLSSINMYFNIYKNSLKESMYEHHIRHTVDLYLGYGWHEEKIRMFNGYQTISTDVFLPTPPAGPFSGLNSTYKMNWRGMRAGFREQSQFSEVLSMNGKFAIGPFMVYNGEGYWNLRSDFANPSFVHSSKGVLFELSANLEWNFWKAISCNIGYMSWLYSAKSGVDRTFFSDGTQAKTKLEKVKTTHRGWLFALSWKY